MPAHRVPALAAAVAVAVSILFLTACGGGAAAPTVNTQSAAPTSAPAAPAPTVTTAPAAPTAEPTTALAPTEAPAATTAPTEEPATVEPTSAPAAAAAAGASAPSGDAIDVIASSMQAMLQQKGIRANLITDAGDSTPITSTIEMVPPGSMHMQTFNGTEIIILRGTAAGGSQMYIKNKSGKWSQMPAELANSITQVANPFDASWVDELRKSITTTPIKFDGVDMVDGKPTWVYEFISTAKIGNGTSISGVTKLWVDMTDKLPRKLETVSDSLLKPGTKSKTTITYDYDPNIKIEPPAM